MSSQPKDEEIFMSNESQLEIANHAHNLSQAQTVRNMTILMDRVRALMSNRTIDDKALIGLLIAYVLLILTGATGNGLVCLAVARKPQMRTARNVFIINLAISDLILCLFTMPFSLVEIVLKFWPLGILTCKLVAGLQATSIFVSTISITAIALDRYKVIIYPTQEACKPLNAILTLTSIWVFALLLAFPMFWFKTVDHVNIADFKIPWIDHLDYCCEKWPIKHGGGFYSIFTMLFQYVLPIIIVSVAYARIAKKLKYRVVSKGTKLQEKQERDKKRMRKTNSLLIAIAIIFVISWLPLNILNILAEFYFPFDNSEFRIVFACCHMVGMSSACSNPLLYGWLNDNFKKEFREIFSTCASGSVTTMTTFNKSETSAAMANARDRTESVVLYKNNSEANGNGGKSLPQVDSTTGRSTEKFDTIVVSSSK